MPDKPTEFFSDLEGLDELLRSEESPSATFAEQATQAFNPAPDATDAFGESPALPGEVPEPKQGIFKRFNEFRKTEKAGNVRQAILDASDLFNKIYLNIDTDSGGKRRAHVEGQKAIQREQDRLAADREERATVRSQQASEGKLDRDAETARNTARIEGANTRAEAQLAAEKAALGFREDANLRQLAVADLYDGLSELDVHVPAELLDVKAVSQDPVLAARLLRIIQPARNRLLMAKLGNKEQETQRVQLGALNSAAELFAQGLRIPSPSGEEGHLPVPSGGKSLDAGASAMAASVFGAVQAAPAGSAESNIKTAVAEGEENFVRAYLSEFRNQNQGLVNTGMEPEFSNGVMQQMENQARIAYQAAIRAHGKTVADASSDKLEKERRDREGSKRTKQAVESLITPLPTGA
jgi:hypothetical protein